MRVDESFVKKLARQSMTGRQRRVLREVNEQPTENRGLAKTGGGGGAMTGRRCDRNGEGKRQTGGQERRGKNGDEENCPSQERKKEAMFRHRHASHSDSTKGKAIFQPNT